MLLKAALIPRNPSSVPMEVVQRISTPVWKNTITVRVLSSLTRHTKCIDGVCRKKCELNYSSCTHDKPLKCPDGLCVGFLEECVSFVCTPDSPYRCPDGVCRSSVGQCSFPLNGRVVKSGKRITKNVLTGIHLVDQKERWVGGLYVEEAVEVLWHGVALSEVEQTTLKAESKFDPLFHQFLAVGTDEVTPRLFLRSAIIKVIVNGNVNKFNKPIGLHVAVDRTLSVNGASRIHKKVG